MKKKNQNLTEITKKISEEVLSQLDDEQLKQIAGGEKGTVEDDELDETCGLSAVCSTCNTKAIE